MCAHLLTLSLSFPPSPYLWVFPLYCFPPEGSTFHMATSLANTLALSIIWSYTKRSFSPRGPETVPERTWVDPTWPSLMGSSDSLLFSDSFSSAITQCLSPTPTSTISFCSRSVLTNTFSVQGGSAGCYLGSGLPDLGLCVFSSIDRSGTLLVKPRVTSVHCSTVCENPK